MPILLNWENDQHTILREMFVGKWTWEEFYQRLGVDVPLMLKAVGHRVDIIADYRESGPLPLGPALTNARNVLQNAPKNWGCIVIVTENRFIRALVDTFRKVFKTGVGARTFAAQSTEEAYQMIAQYQASLDAAPLTPLTGTK